MEPDTAASQPTMFSVPVALGDRTITAYVDANTQEEAQALIESRRERVAKFNPNENVYVMRSETGGYGYSYDTADEATARANVQKGMANMDAIARFTNENAELDSTAENNYGAVETNDIMSEIDALNAEAAQNAPGKSLGDMASGAAKDVAFGLGVEAPTQILAGAASGINETFDAIQIAGNELSKIVPNPYVVWSGVGDGVAGNAQFRVGMTGRGGSFERDAQALGVDLNESPLPEVPVVGQQPTSVTGGVVRALSQFGASMGIAGRALKGWQTTSTIGKFSKAMVTGAIADFAAFDETDKRLSDLIETVPELSNPVTEWLASDEDDTALESRLKNVVEGGLIGVGLEAIGPMVKQISAYRQLKRAQAQIKPQADQLMAETIAAERKVVTDLNEAMKVLGDPEADLVRVKATRKAADMAPIEGNATEAAAMTRTADAVGGTPQRPQDAAQAQATGDAAPSFGENPFEINFSKISQPDDVNSIIAQMIESRPDAIDAARRGVQTWEQSKAGAEALTQSDKAFVDLLSRRPGQAANDKETIALRMLWGESGAKLREVAKMAADNPTDANMMVFRQMLSVHGTIEEAAMGARAEAGRALQTWRMPVGSSEAIATRVRELVNGSDGALRQGNIDLARQIGALDDSTIGEIARKAPQMTNAQRMRTIIQSAMLTAPSTHVANITGNAMGMVFETALRALAPMTTGGTGTVREGEATAMFAGQLQAFWDVIRAGDKFKAFWNTAEKSGGKAEMNAQHMFPKMAGSKNQGIRAVANVGDFLVKLPGGATNAMDNVFKYALTSGSLNATAFRKAMDEVNAGALNREDVVKRQRELVANPTDDMIDEAGRLSEEATFSRSQETWTDSEGRSGPGWGKIMLNIRQAAERGGPAGGYASGVIMPFINTPANLMSYAFRSSPLAPMMARYQKDLAEGGARAEIARTRMMAGSAIMWTAFSLAASGQLSGGGPIDPQQRQLLQRQGWQPYSVRVGDTWYSYSRLDPMGTLFSIASDLGDIALNTDWDEMDSIEQWSEIAATTIGAIGNAYVNKSMLSGAADLFEFMGDPKRYGEQFVLSKLSAPIPAIAGLGERLADPYAREPMVTPRESGGANDILSGLESFMQQAKTRIPGVSETLPIRRDMWGRPQMQVSGMGTAWEILSPSRASKNKWEPIDGELERLRYYPPNMQKTVTVPEELSAGPGDDRKYSLSDRPDIYNRILEVRGEIILPRLNAMVNGESDEGAIYLVSDDVAKQEMIENVMSEGNKIARAQVIQEYYVDFAMMSAKKADAIGVAPAPVE
jgi:hypothetical protein